MSSCSLATGRLLHGDAGYLSAELALCGFLVWPWVLTMDGMAQKAYVSF